MKKTISVIILTLFCGFAFAQQWIGNTNTTNMVMLEDSEFAIAPKHCQSDIEGLISKIKFYRTTYDTYACDTYTLRIYENPNLQIVDEQNGYYDLQSCGTEVYSQEFTATEEGWIEVPLTTPYAIGEADFWISIQMHGEGMLVIGGQANAVEDQYYYTCEDNFVWYWSFPYFYDSEYNRLLYSCALAAYNGEPTDIAENAPISCTIFPNPMQDVVSINANQPIQTVSIFDVFGKLVSTFEVNEKSATLPVTNLSAGTYILKAQTATDIFTQKVIKK